jgi:virginiamycin A acetyltransferase
MENSMLPDPNVIFPVPNIKTVTYVKPTIKNKNIIVGDFTYISDIDFESHVTHFYDFYNDKLIIGKFCQIASGMEFIINALIPLLHNNNLEYVKEKIREIVNEKLG